MDTQARDRPGTKRAQVNGSRHNWTSGGNVRVQPAHRAGSQTAQSTLAYAAAVAERRRWPCE